MVSCNLEWGPSYSSAMHAPLILLVSQYPEEVAEDSQLDEGQDDVEDNLRRVLGLVVRVTHIGQRLHEGLGGRRMRGLAPD